MKHRHVRRRAIPKLGFSFFQAVVMENSAINDLTTYGLGSDSMRVHETALTDLSASGKIRKA
jgi:hypothetical protein